MPAGKPAAVNAAATASPSGSESESASFPNSDSSAWVIAAWGEGVSAEALVVDHRLQPGSADVARTAVAEAARMGMAAQIRPVDVPPGENMEAAARRVRYAALVVAAAGRPVLVGHTGDDQAETLLLTALRGNPAGMRAVSGQVHRPLLGLRRADTVGACRELGLRPWSDPHNDDPAFRRVAVRTRVMDLLTEITGADPRRIAGGRGGETRRGRRAARRARR